MLTFSSSELEQRGRVVTGGSRGENRKKKVAFLAAEQGKTGGETGGGGGTEENGDVGGWVVYHDSALSGTAPEALLLPLFRPAGLGRLAKILHILDLAVVTGRVQQEVTTIETKRPS